MKVELLELQNKSTLESVEGVDVALHVYGIIFQRLEEAALVKALSPAVTSFVHDASIIKSSSADLVFGAVVHNVINPARFFGARIFMHWQVDPLYLTLRWFSMVPTTLASC